VSVWLTDLADILRKANVAVIEETYNRGPYKGKLWKSVGFMGRGLSRFSYVMWHHDASPEGDSPGALEWMKYMSVAPAAAAWVCLGCHGKHFAGTWHVYAAGLSNHAGTGGPWAPNNGAPNVPKDAMNAVCYGIEVDHTLGESWAGVKKQAQLNGLRKGTAAIMKAYNLDPRTRLIRHLDWTNGEIDGNRRFQTYGRKNDLAGIDLDYERRLVEKLMGDAVPDSRKVARIKRHIRTWRRRRDEIRDSGKTAGLSTARKKIKELNQRLKKLTGQ
jgi:hypothetical protein